MDKIVIKNMELYGFHGVLDEERVNGQNFFVDVELKLKLNKASSTDSLEDTVDYSKIFGLISDINEFSKFRLIEKFAGTICKEILARFEKVIEIKVKVRKPEAPIDFEFDYIEVELKRGRDD
ncbi:MAG: dihydroneopterin aldolase [Clostridia bacterium]|jgi:dihydroneopterin aldolase